MATTGARGARHYEPDLYPGEAPGTWNDQGTWKDQEESTVDSRPTPSRVEDRRKRGNRVDAWMEQDFKFGGSRIKRKTITLVILGAPAVLPLFFMLPALFTVNYNTFQVAVDDVLGTGAEMFLFFCLLVTPMMMLTGQRWFFPLRRWYGLMMGACALGDGIAAGLTDAFHGNFIERLTEHSFVLVGFTMLLLVLPLMATGNPWAQRKLGRYWKPLHRLIYVIWGLLFIHLILLEGFGFQTGSRGSGNVGDGDAVFHQRLYQFSACSVLLLTLRLPPVKRWIAARQQEGRGRLVTLTVAPLFALFILSMIFITNELIFKGVAAFNNTPSHE